MGRARLAALLVFGAACSSSAPRAPGPPRDPETARALDALEAVDRAVRRGELAEGREALQDLLEEGIPETLAMRADALDRLLSAREWTERLEEAARVEIDRTPLPAGERIRLRLVLENRGGEPVAIRGVEEAPSAGLLVVSFREWSPYAGEAGETRTTPFALPPFEVPSGGRWEEAREVGTPEEAGFAVREYRVSAELRPGRFEADGRLLPVARIRLREGRARVCPRGFEAIARDPLEALRTALAGPSPAYDRHVVLAAAFVPEEAREEAREDLEQALTSNDPRRRRAAAAALRYLEERARP